MIISGSEGVSCMRVTVIVMAAAFLTASAAAQTQQSPPQQPPQQPPVFRGGVELLTVDATVLDNEGRQIKDLKPQEFTIEVDGSQRPIVSAEYIKLVDDTPVPVGARRAPAPRAEPDEAFFSTNTRSVSPGRIILLVV